MAASIDAAIYRKALPPCYFLLIVGIVRTYMWNNLPDDIRKLTIYRRSDTLNYYLN